MLTNSNSSTRCLKRLGAALWVGGITFLAVAPLAQAQNYTLMTLGDSLTSGFPNATEGDPDTVSYQFFIDENLPGTVTYFGNPDDGTADSGAAIVGGNGRYVSRIPVVGGPAVVSVFPANGVQDRFTAISPIQIPQFAVVLVGLNDMIQLAEPNNGMDIFTPDTAGDFTGSGTFKHFDGGGNSTDFNVDPLIDRYGALLDVIAVQFPPSTEIICLALPPIDPDGSFGGEGATFKAKLAPLISGFNTKIETLTMNKGVQFTFLDPNLDLDDLFDGVHPNPGGYEKIGIEVADFIKANNPPTLDATVGNKTVNEGGTLTFSISGSDPDAGQDVSYSISGDIPAGASMNANGDFTWTPTEAQGPDTYTIDLVVTDDGPGTRNAAERITVTVNEVNAAPNISPPGNQSINELNLLEFTVSANDNNDVPANGLSFSLDGSAPSGASIDPDTGVFSWTPTEAQAGMDHTFEIIVMDDGTPSKEDREEITVSVNDLNSGSPKVIMTMGGSHTFGLPGFDNQSYHTFLDRYLATTYVGVADSFANSGDVMVGGAGNYITRSTQAGGPGVTAVFPADGVQQEFNAIKDTVTVPEFAVLLAGLSDLIQLIDPNDSNDTFVPSVNGNFTSSGVYTDSNGAEDSVNHNIDSVADRYGSLLDEIAGAFPASTKVLCLALPPIDPNGNFTNSQRWTDNSLQSVLAANIPLFNSAIDALVASKGSQFLFVDPGVTLTQLENNGVFPTLGGYDTIALAIAGFVNGNTPPELDAIGDQTVQELDTLTFNANATDPDGDDITYSLRSPAPVGASISATTGAFSWTPTIAQGPATYTVEVIATDNGQNAFTDSEIITITVTDPNAGDPWNQWLASLFTPSQLDPANEATIWGREANPDGDEWTNEFEFYLNTNPQTPEEPQISGSQSGDNYVVSFSKNENAPVDWVEMEYSTNLSDWLKAGLSTPQSTGAAVNGAEPMEVTLTLPNQLRVFFRFANSTP